MIGLVMCGGRGTRMGGGEEKLLLRYKKPVVQHVISALQESGCFSKVVCATSPNAPRTAEFVRGLGVQTLGTAGRGYVQDLGEAIRNFGEEVFVASGDLALLDVEIVKKIASMRDPTRTWTSVIVSEQFLGTLGTRAEFVVRYEGRQCAYTGISIVNPEGVEVGKHVDEGYILIDDRRVAVNLNTKKDFDLLGAA